MAPSLGTRSALSGLGALFLLSRAALAEGPAPPTYHIEEVRPAAAPAASTPTAAGSEAQAASPSAPSQAPSAPPSPDAAAPGAAAAVLARYPSGAFSPAERLDAAFEAAAAAVSSDAGLGKGDRKRALEEFAASRRRARLEVSALEPAAAAALIEALDAGRSPEEPRLSREGLDALLTAWSQAEAGRNARARDYLLRKDGPPKGRPRPAEHLAALAGGLVPEGTVYAPGELGWDIAGASRLRVAPRSGPSIAFAVEGSTAAPASILLDRVRRGRGEALLLRAFDASGRLTRWDLDGKEGEEGLFDDRGGLLAGRAWRGDEQTATIRGADQAGRPQIRFVKYRRGRKLGARTITIDPETRRPVQIEEFDAAGRLLSLATLAATGPAAPEPGSTLSAFPPAPPPPKPAPPPRPKPQPKPAKPPAPKATPKPAALAGKPPAAPKPPAPAPRPLAAPPSALLAPAADGSFASAAAAIRRFGPMVGKAGKLVVDGPAGRQTWVVRREADGRALGRREVVNDLVLREVVRSFYAELFDTPAAVGFEAGGSAALVERLAEGAAVQPGYRPFAPRERTALATLCLVFGLADAGPERFRWRDGRKPVLVGLRELRRAPFKLPAEEAPLIPVEVRTGRLPFVRPGHGLPLEDYREEAARVRAQMEAPGFAGRFRERLVRAGLSQEEARSYWEAARSNLARFEENLAPFLEAAKGLEGDLSEPAPK